MRQYRVVAGFSVKSRAVSRALLAVLGLGIWLGLLEHPAHAERRPETVPPLLLGGARENAQVEVELDPLLPRGALRPLTAPHGSVEQRLCSATRPLCTEAPDPERRQLGLALLELAYERQRFGAGLPTPRGGATEGFVWTVSDGTSSPDELRVELQELPRLHFDRAEARCRGGRLTERDAQRCLLEAALGERSPSAAPPLRAGMAAASAWDLSALHAEDHELLRLTQRAPERSLLSGGSSDEPGSIGLPVARSAIFFRYLNDSAERPAPASTSFLALALTATRTPPGSLRYEAEPDLFDVLRASYGGDRARLAHFFDDFAAARAQLGRSDGWLGGELAPTPPELAWHILEGSLPRNLRLPRPLEPFGSAYLRLDLNPDPDERSLALRISCESPVSYVWSIARLDGEGRELSRVRIPYQDQRSLFEQRVEIFQEDRALLLLGTNLGGVDLAHPFDPDHGPHEAHGCSVYLTRL